MGGKGPLCEEEEECECLDRHVGSRCIRKMDGPVGGEVKMMEYRGLLRLEGVKREGEEESECTSTVPCPAQDGQGNSSTSQKGFYCRPGPCAAVASEQSPFPQLAYGSHAAESAQAQAPVLALA